MIAVLILLGITIIVHAMDRNTEKKEQIHREKILCEIDKHRMAEIQKLRQEIERLKRG